jgi:hypothetical protein
VSFKELAVCTGPGEGYFPLFEVGELIHVYPNARRLHIVISRDVFESLCPEKLSVRRVKIRVVNLPRPNAPNEISTRILTRFYENIELGTSISRFVSYGDSGVYDRNPVHSEFVLKIGELLHVRDLESRGVDCEIPQVLHVVNIAPENIEGQIIAVIAVPNIEQFA